MNDNSSPKPSPPRLSPEERLKQFKAGSIVRIKLQNFLTYANVEFKPGPRLNVVIGPNGTGKSTILCAICLGLGGQPPLLGRADDARTFIKNDEDIAQIEIELKAPQLSQKNDVIRRVIDRHKGSERGRGIAASTYYINDKVSNLKSVQALVSRKYHIAIDNLCTFLPQDRVGSFSGFDSKMLLEETEKCVVVDGSSSQEDDYENENNDGEEASTNTNKSNRLYDTHMQLIELEKEILESDTNLQTIQDKAQSLQNEVDQLEKMKELMDERQRHLKKLEKFQQKLAWVLFDLKRDEALRLKEQRNEVKILKKKAEQKVRPINIKMEEISVELSKNDERKRVLKREMKNAMNSYDSNLTKNEKYRDEIDSCQVDLSEIDSLRRRAEARVNECRIKLEQNQTILSGFTPEKEMVDAHKTAQDEQRVIRQKIHKVKQSLSHLQHAFKDKKEEFHQASEKYERMKDEKARRNEKILNSDKALLEAYKYVRNNGKEFRRKVWGPIVCEITTNDIATSNCLEQHVKNAVWKSFVVECIEDYNLLYREVREKAKIPINIQMVKNGQLEPVTRKYSDRKMQVLKREHGVQGYLDECFTAPDAILQALRNTSKVEHVLVGSEKTTDSLNNGLMDMLNQKENGEGLQAACIFSTDKGKTFKYTSIISRYSGKASLNVDEISEAKMLRPGVAAEQKELVQNIIKSLEAELKQMEPSMREKQEEFESLTRDGQEVTSKLKDAQQGIKELREIKNKVEVAKRKLRDAESEISKDSTAEKRELKNKLCQSVKRGLASLQAASEKYDEYLKTCTDLAGIELSEEGKRQEFDNLREKKIEAESETRELEQQYQSISKRFSMEKDALVQLSQRANQIAPIKDANGNDLPLKAELDELPGDRTALEEEIENAKDKINSIHDNPEVMKRYEEQKSELELVKEQLENMKTSKDAKRKALHNIREPWEKALDGIVQKVNGLFSQYMKELGCAGEVRLAKGENNRGRSNSNDQESLGNFKEWGVQILVKFREKSDLQVLSAQVHSGGERSVSTIMYLMAMQNMMVSPFRCVDEINQGLDERNERLVFRRIVQNSTKLPDNKDDPTSHCGQYFLITPKLLPNLTDMENENVTVHCIFNGPYNFKHFGDWDVDNFLNAKKRMSRSQIAREGKENEPDDSRHHKKVKSND